MQYIPTIGLEIHAELSTASKIFCSCPVQFGGEPNTRCCPVCIGLPGTLPVLNERAVQYAVIAGLALNCTINKYSKFDRKNYFYPDLPKAYQISQFDMPICSNGYVDIDTPEGTKRIRIRRIHLEEDAGKLIHDIYDKYSLADYNRCGVPLIEIVTEPDLTSSEEAKTFIEKVRLQLLYAGISDCKMEEGSMRADVNVSVRSHIEHDLGTRTEMKNLNSIRAIARAIDNEIKRQAGILSEGGIILQETRRWDDNRGDSMPLRSKEESHDYRYFPEPDILPLILEEDEIKQLEKQLPKMPQERYEQYTGQYGISDFDARLILSSKKTADIYEAAVSISGNPKTTASFITVELLRQLNDRALSPEVIPFDGNALGSLIQMIDSNQITNNNAKKVLAEMFDSTDKPSIIAERAGLLALDNESMVETEIQKVLEANKKAVNEYLEGNEKTFGYIMGQCSKALSGRADPQLMRTIILKLLAEFKR